jgi:predicted permease
MSSIRGLVHVLRALFLRARVDAELDAELRDHEAREVERQLRDGAPERDARRQAALRMGSLEAARENVRDERGGRLAADLLSDVRIGWRGLRRNTGLTAAIVLSLGLGDGGTTAVFSVVDAVLLRPLPYPDADRLHFVSIWWNSFQAPSISIADIEALRDHARPVATVGAFTYPASGFTMLSNSGPEVVQGARVSHDLPAVLGIAPVVGAGFSSNREAPEVLISQSLWRSRFGGAGDVIGRSLTFDGVTYTIVGVMPAGFNVPGQRDGQAWTRGQPRPPTRRGPFFSQVIARLNSPDRAAAEARLTEIVRPVLQERFGVKPNWRYGLDSVKETLVGDIRTTLTMASAAAGLVLLVAVLNVANLLLARGSVRGREMAVRASLGAGRGRLVRQLLAEAGLLGALGGALGLGLAFIALRLSHDAALMFVPRVEGAGLGPIVVAAALITGVGAAALSALVPVFRLPWGHLTDSLRDGRGSGEGPRQGRVRRVLVAAEIALTLTVLVGAALLMKSLGRLERADPGFDAQGVVTARLSLPDARYDAERTLTFLTELESRLRALPRVSSVAFSTSAPPNALDMSNNYTIEGEAPDGAGDKGVAEWMTVSGDYFRTLGIRMTAGRPFAASDRFEEPSVVIVNDAFVRRHFPGQNAVGKRLKGGDWNPTSPWATIVGVAADVPYARGVWGGAQPSVYTASTQMRRLGAPWMMVRTSGDAAQLVPTLRAAVQGLDAELPLRNVATMAGRLRASTLAPRFRGLLASALASIAVALAVTGIYGVMSYHVNQRRRETAIRRALGAAGRQVIGAVVGSGLRLTALGVALGCAGALVLSRSMSTLLYQVEPTDPGVLAIAAGVLTATATLACAVPAIRAARVDPVTILRDE